MTLSDEELERYARHIVLKEIGGAGQLKLKAARVAVIGAGGIGSPALQYLAAAGVGHLTIVDDDQVDLSNLQRQTMFGTSDAGKSKAAASAARIAALNPHVAVTVRQVRLAAENAAELLAGHDAVLDGTDNFATRLDTADAALILKIPLISAAVGQFEGQLSVFRGWESDKPCYRCLTGPNPETPGLNCSEQGVLGALTGLTGSLAALETIRTITPFGDDTAGKLLIADTLSLRFRTLTLPKDPGCPACSGG